ncbi:hypothetical protein IHE45_08G084400 [Dioscorea alata]|uniref:Uncharacterized protein n=1 Tax=Dioscorea alata TaxID=55571 RepID=A0ACB7VKG8_DIOAL|nr:hypothetical protein IHE45_08G084400 [Dioscorea alata]
MAMVLPLHPPPPPLLIPLPISILFSKHPSLLPLHLLPSFPKLPSTLSPSIPSPTLQTNRSQHRQRCRRRRLHRRCQLRSFRPPLLLLPQIHSQARSPSSLSPETHQDPRPWFLETQTRRRRPQRRRRRRERP